MLGIRPGDKRTDERVENVGVGVIVTVLPFNKWLLVPLVFLSCKNDVRWDGHPSLLIELLSMGKVVAHRTDIRL